MLKFRKFHCWAKYLRAGNLFIKKINTTFAVLIPGSPCISSYRVLFYIPQIYNFFCNHKLLTINTRCSHSPWIYSSRESCGTRRRKNTAWVSKPSRFSMLGSITTLSITTELILRSEKEKSITCWFMQRSYGPYDGCEKTLISFGLSYNNHQS